MIRSPAIARPRAARLAATGCALAFLLLAALAPAQNYPTRPIRLIVPQAPGGGTDILARNVAQKLGEDLRQAAIVENRPGAGSLIGTEYVAKAPPDGYTLLVGGIFNMVMNKALIKNLSYDPQRDFVPIGFTSAYPFLLLVRSDLPVASLADLVKYAKERPGKLSFGSAGLGTLQHVWGTILFRSLGLDMLHVPHKGAAPAHQEILAGRLDMMFDNLSASKQYVQSGRMKGLVVSSPGRSTHLPNVPTINETGVTRFEGESWFGLFAPSGVPREIVDQLRRNLASIVRDPGFVQRVERDGGRVLLIPPAQQQKFLEEEIERWGRLVAQYDVTAEADILPLRAAALAARN